MTQRYEARETLKIDRHQMEHLLGELEHGFNRPKVSRRQFRRFRFRQRHCEVLLWHVDDPSTMPSFRSGSGGRVEIWPRAEVRPRIFLMETRNLSVMGISLLHGAFIHPGVCARVALTARNGETRHIEGRVVACRYLRQGVHEVGVRFESPIRIRDYCPEADDLTDEFVGEIRAQVDSLKQALDDEGWRESVRILCDAVRTRAIGYGMDDVGEAAQGIALAAPKVESIEPLKARVDELLSICARHLEGASDQTSG